MMTVIDIRGTHGSGKTFLMKRLLRKYRHSLIMEDGKLLGYHLKGVDAGLLGSYNGTAGGCDRIPKPDEITRRIRLFAKRYRHVLLEGLFVSHTFQRYSDLAEEMQDYGYTFCFLDTPLTRCIKRCRERRLQSGKKYSYPFNPSGIEKEWQSIWVRVQTKCVAANHNAVVLDHKKPLTQVVKMLRS